MEQLNENSLPVQKGSILLAHSATCLAFCESFPGRSQHEGCGSQADHDHCGLHCAFAFPTLALQTALDTAYCRHQTRRNPYQTLSQKSAHVRS